MGHTGAACQVNGWMCRCVIREYLFLAKSIPCTYTSFYALWHVSMQSQGGPSCRHKWEQRNSPFLHVKLARCFCLTWSPLISMGSKRIGL